MSPVKQEHTGTMGSLRRKTQYKRLLDEIASLDEAVEDITNTDKNLEAVNKTAKVIEETKNLLSDGAVQERVDNPGEGLLDSKVLLASSGMVIKCSEGISGNVNTYDPDELADHVKHNLEYWESFAIPGRIPPYLYLHGTFSPTPAERKQPKERKKVQKQNRAEAKEPEDVQRLEKSETGSEMVKRLQKNLNKCCKNNQNQPISYFHFVTDPDSFSHTVENIYNLSFLVRDGFASVTLDDDDGLPYVKPIMKSNQQSQSESRKSDVNQFIVSIDMDRWKKIIETFNIRKPLMN